MFELHDGGTRQLPTCLLLLQPKQQTLELRHGFCRSIHFHKCFRLRLRALRKKTAVQFNFLAGAGLSQIQLVVNSTWPQERLVETFNPVRSHHEQDIRGRVETIQHIQQPRKRDSVPISKAFVLTAGLSIIVGGSR
jgi:hypothetical protein